MISNAWPTLAAQRRLAELLSPVSPETFFNDYWEKRPLVLSHQDPDFLGRFFTVRMFTELLEQRHLRFPGVRIFLNRQETPSKEFTATTIIGMEQVSGVVDSFAIWEHYHRGATIHVIGLERMSGSLRRLTDDLESEFGFPLHATAFLTPQSADNVPAHEDPSDFLILQIGGEKRWRVWGPVQRTGASSESRISDDRPSQLTSEEPLLDVNLSAGDVLYVPTGFYHQAITSGRYSLHLTLVINPYRWFDVVGGSVRDALAQLRAHPRFQQALPSDPQSPQARQQFLDLMSDLRRAILPDQGLRIMDRHLLAGKYPARPGQILDLTRLPGLSLGSKVKVRVQFAYQLVEDQENLSLMFHNKQLIFPLFVKPSLEYILRATILEVGAIEGGLGDDEKLALARRLLMEGFLTFVE